MGMYDESYGNHRIPGYEENPDSFRSGGRPVEELPVKEARAHLDFLMRAGLPSIGPWAEYYRRFSYALTPIIVVMLSAALTGLVRKNILLMSLLDQPCFGYSLLCHADAIHAYGQGRADSTPSGAFAPVILFSLLYPWFSGSVMPDLPASSLLDSRKEH
jgi:hypothetical protein